MPDETKQTPESEENKGQKKNKKKRPLFRRIVNWFLYFFLGLFVLLLIVFAITQTSTFREYLRETVISEANSALNGTVYIEKIEGTIFTSLLLRNTVVNMESDTLLHAGTIELKTSPLQLLLKKIKVRYFEIKDARVALIEDSTGTLNVVNLLPPSEPDTTAAGEFPFDIVVSDFRLTNINFSLQRYDYVNSSASYDSLNMNDLRVKDLNIALNAAADINENDFELQLDRLSASPNINNFILKNLTGNFTLNPEDIIADDLHIITGNSDIEISLEMNNYNLFDSTAADRLGDAEITAKLETGGFNFTDLTPFVPSMSIMKGTINTDAELSGTINNLIVDKVQVNFLNTQLALNGSVKDIMNSESMFITADFYDTYINPDDINKLMPSLQIPVYKEAGVLKFDTLTYEGSPQNFKTSLVLQTNIGSISVNGRLNFESALMAYNLNLRTNGLNIAPFAGVSSDLNLRAAIEGEGTSPEELSANVNMTADGSVIDGNNIDTLRLTANAENKLIEFQLITASDSMGADLTGSVDFTNSDNPAYVLDGRIRNLDIAQFTKDTTSTTNLNLTLNAEGENFDPELMNLYLSLTLFESSINDIAIDSTRAIVDLRKDDGGQRVINFISDLADITLIGNFSIPKTIELMSNEADVISTIINNKLNQIIPAAMDSTNISTAQVGLKKTPTLVEHTDSLTSIVYLIDLKSLDLISLFLDDNRLEVDGEMSGEINSTGDSLLVTFNAAIEHVKYWGADDIFFVSNFNLDLSLANDINASSFDDIYADMNLTTDRIFAGTDIHKLSMELELKNQEVQIDFSTIIEDYATAQINGSVNLTGDDAIMSFDTLGLTYNHFTLRNDSVINLSYSKSGIDIRDFVLVRNGGNISIKGTLGESGDQNLNIALNNISGRDISVNLLGNQDDSFDALINLETEISGNFSAPIIDLRLEVDSVKYQNSRFGSLTAGLDYKEKNLAVDIKFIDSVITSDRPALEIAGNIPIDMAFTGVEERFPESGEMDVTLRAENFNLGAFGDLLPAINRLRGSLAADLKLSGSLENPNPSGYIRLSDAAFIVEMNNLEYNAGLKVTISQDNLSIDSMIIKNAEGTENGGTMRISGKAELDNFNITSSQFIINGDLKILDEVSRTASPAVYGELVIGTRGNVEFTADEGGTMLTAPITIKEASLTFPPTQGAYQNTSANFIYKFVEDTTQISGTGPDFETLINLSKERSAEQQSARDESATFDFRIDMKIEDEATIVFPLSRELNQNLTAVLSGNIVYESIDGRTDAQGEFKLLDESTLEFIKTLSAEGTIRFENDLTNPYLDITATYQDYYYEPDADGDNSDGEPIPVAVKIKITGLLSELNKTFIQDENSIAVYYGLDDIENDNPTAGYDKSDAVYFIITGNFIDQASAGPNSNIAVSQATAIAGSVLGGFLNRELGDYVKSVELRQVGGDTRFNLSGRVNKFRYTIGGSQNVFQDIGQANVRIEYPLIEDLLIRLERKRSLNSESTNTTDEMINELGLRYRFEF
ncbi:MAG: hypothetical protein R6W90_06295 [Ignavibacteriaceae bacterium]